VREFELPPFNLGIFIFPFLKLEEGNESPRKTIGFGEVGEARVIKNRTPFAIFDTLTKEHKGNAIYQRD